MERKTCIYCGKEVKLNRATCPKCGSARFYSGQEVIFTPPGVRPKRPMIPWWAVMLAGLLLLLLSFYPGKPAVPRSCPHDYEQVTSTPPSYGRPGIIGFCCSLCGETAYETAPSLPPVVEITALNAEGVVQKREPLEALDGSTIPLPDTHSIRLELKVQNLSQKSIKDLNFKVYAEADNTVWTGYCFFDDLSIPAGSFVLLEDTQKLTTHTLGANTPEWVIYYTDFADITFYFEVMDVTFEEAES